MSDTLDWVSDRRRPLSDIAFTPCIQAVLDWFCTWTREGFWALLFAVVPEGPRGRITYVRFWMVWGMDAAVSPPGVYAA